MASSPSDNPHSGTEELATESDVKESTYMSVYWSNDKIGISYYGTEGCILYMMVDTQEIMGTNVFKRAFLQVLPTTLLVCSKDKDKIISALKEMKPDENNLDKTVRVLPSVDFSIAACKQRLTLMNLPNAPKDLTDSEKSIYISTLVQTDNSNMTKCVGALLHFLEKNRIGIELEPNISQVPVVGFKFFNIQDFLMLDSLTYKSLQIFKEELHPAGLISNNKEGFSLFSLLKRCRSTSGANMMKKWFRHPLSDKEAINNRLDVVEFFLQSSNFELASLLEGALKGTKNIVPLLKRMIKSQCRFSDWKVLHQTLLACLEVNELLIKSGYPKLDVFTQLKDIFATDGLSKLSGYMSCMVDFEETALNQRFCMKPNISPDLDMKKEIYDNLSNIMAEVCARERESLDPALKKDCKVIYFPQIGYMLTVTLTKDMEMTKDFSLPGKEYMFAANGTVYYKTEETKNMDQVYGDIRCDIIDIEAQHMDALQTEVINASSLISSAVACIAEVDCLLSFANCARIYGYVRPKMLKEQVIEIINGRHPLLEVVGTFIANSTRSSYPGKMHVITGANSSGKSVYLKQIGLIFFMAQIGSFVPADSATLGIIDQIFTVMQSPHSVSYEKSSFLMDINQLSVALGMASARSLILLDEFGRGTQEEDGASLLAATIRHLDRLGPSCPHTFISTHFHILNEAKLLPESPNIKYLKTVVIIEDKDQVTYLYQLEDGVAESSHAMAVAQAVGLPDHVLQRARQIYQWVKEGKQIQPMVNGNSEISFEKCQKLCDAFLKFDFENGDIDEFIREAKCCYGN